MLKYILISILSLAFISCSQEEYEGFLNIEVTSNFNYEQDLEIIANNKSTDVQNNLRTGYSFISGKFLFEFYKRGDIQVEMLTPDSVGKKIRFIPREIFKDYCSFFVENSPNKFTEYACHEIKSDQTELIDKIKKIKLSFSILASTGKKRVFVLSANLDNKHLLADGHSVDIDGDFTLNLFLKPVIKLSGVTKNSSLKNEGNVNIDVYPAVLTKQDEISYRYERKFSIKSDSSGNYEFATIFDELNNSQNDFNSLYFNNFFVATKGDSIGFSVPGKINSYSSEFLKSDSIIKKVACSQISMGGDNIKNYINRVCKDDSSNEKKICYFYNHNCKESDSPLFNQCVFSPQEFKSEDKDMIEDIQNCLGDQIGDLYSGKNLSNISLALHNTQEILKREPLISTVYLPKLTSILDLENVGRGVNTTDQSLQDLNRVIYDEISVINSNQTQPNISILSGTVFFNGFNLKKLLYDENLGKVKGFKIEYKSMGEIYTLKYNGPLVLYNLPQCHKLINDGKECSTDDFIFFVVQNRYPFFTLTKKDNSNNLLLQDSSDSLTSILIPNTINIKELYSSLEIKNIYFIYDSNGEESYKSVFESNK